MGFESPAVRLLSFSNNNRGCESIVSILIDKNTKVITQGITGKTALFHAKAPWITVHRWSGNFTRQRWNRSRNTLENGETVKLPVYNTVEEAKAKTGATASVIYVPRLLRIPFWKLLMPRWIWLSVLRKAFRCWIWSKYPAIWKARRLV